jgi:hypothetical protein
MWFHKIIFLILFFFFFFFLWDLGFNSGLCAYRAMPPVRGSIRFFDFYFYQRISFKVRGLG